ncbi:MAG: MBL fold metallo-hydrolase, partial [Pseudomonadota bacterium]
VPEFKPTATPQEWAEQCKPWDDWDKPAPPFQIFGDVYYVGTCGITVLLVRTTNGFVLLDTGTENGAVEAMRNIDKMGIAKNRIGLILYTHEHFDHVGGMSLVQLISGAPVLATPIAAEVLKTGKDSPQDPQHGMHGPMKPVTNVITITPETLIVQGGKTFTPIATPGHTPGALSWQWESCEGDVCKTIVYADSLSPVSRDDYKFSDHPEYLEAYRAGLDRIKNLKCDILLTPHPSHSKMIQRAKTGSFEGGVTCSEYAAGKHRDLDARLEREAGGDQ